MLSGTLHNARSGIRMLVWMALTALVVALASIPTTLAVQALLGVVVVGVILALRAYSSSVGIRLLLLGVASIIVLRYWFWRLLNTLPGLDDPVSFFPALLLFLVETYLIGVFFLGNLMVADPVRHKRPKALSVDALPTVDVLVPTLDEPRDLLAITLAAAKNMSYPEHLLTVVLCDDGGTDARCIDPNPAKAAAALKRRKDLQALCDELGVVYMTRPENVHAKAGNLNEALARLNGELVVIFDSDHAPSTDFLARTVGYFAEDEKLFLVQTPHFFLNDDPVARNLRLGESSPAENEMFYGILHEGLDRWGGAFFCGSAAILRRTALDEVGGISGNTITEDAETALQIHCNGWRSMYLNHAMIAGLQPETFASFLTQRGRWATGMIQLFVTRNPFLLRGLSLFQRLCYFNSMSFWIFPLLRMTLLLAPLAYLFFGIELFVATATEAIGYMSTYILVMYLVQNTLFGTARRPFVSEIYEIAQTPYLVKATIGAMINPRGAKFKVTSKNESIEETILSDVYRPLLLLFGLMVAACGVLAYRWTMFPGDRSVLQIVGIWIVFNTLIVGAALRSVVETRQRRIAPRVATSIPAFARPQPEDPEEPNLPGQVVNISYTGALLALLPRPDQRPHRRYSPGDRIRIVPTKAFGFDKATPVTAEVANVRAAGDRLMVGLTFDQHQTEMGYRTIAAMLNGDSSRWQQIRAERSKHVGLIRGFASFLWLAVSGILSTFSIIIRRPARGSAQDQANAESGWAKDAPIEEQAFAQSENAPRFVLPGDHSLRGGANPTGA